MAKGDDEKDGEGRQTLPFMFGNVDKKGRLDEDYLDEDAKDRIHVVDGVQQSREREKEEEAPRRAGGHEAMAPRRSTVTQQVSHGAGPSLLGGERVGGAADLEEDENYDEDDDYDENGETEGEATPAPTPSQAKPSPMSVTPASPPAVPQQQRQPPPRRKKRLSFSEPPRKLLALGSVLAKDDLSELLKADRASMEEERRARDQNDGSSGGSLTQEEGAFETAMDAAAATFDHDQGDSTYSRFRPGVPLCEAFREKQEASIRELGSGAAYLGPDAFQPVLNEDWEQAIGWDDSEEDGGGGGGDWAAGMASKEMAFGGARSMPRVEGGGWVDEIRWGSDEDVDYAGGWAEAPARLDLEDPGVIVEEVGAPGDDTREEVDLLRLSNDAYYTEQKKKQGGTAKTRPFDQKARHSAPALKMLSLRLTETMAKHELRCLHRPQGQFIPKKRSAAAAMGLKFGGSYQVNVRLRSLVGYDYTIPQPFAANSTTIEDLWKTAKQLQPRLQKAFKADRPKLMLADGAGKKMKPLKSNSVLGEGENGLHLKGDATFWIVTNKVTLIPNSNYRQFKEPLRPPGAFKNMRDLSIRDGHLFLLEYVEEHPLLLSNQGMGLRLLSFYRKRDESDESWRQLRVGKVRSPQDGEWGKFGKVVPLEDSDDPPFLGDVQKGQHQLGVDCNLFRAPAFYHTTQQTDFLLVRSSLGRWMVREITSTLAVGQQEPRVKTPWPGSVQIREFEEKRFQDYVFRTLKRKIKEQAAGRNVVPELQVQGLKFLFPNNSEQLIRNRLRNQCHCVPVNQAQADGRWSLKPGARIPEEVELRQNLTPEMVCAYESMRSSQERYAELGMKRHELLRVSNERLKLATELLPGGEEARAAAKFIEQMIQVASWAMVTNYLDVMKDGRGAFSITGLGDPSGRGRCVSFVKTHGRGLGLSEGPKKPTIIAGTKTDLRRLSMGKAEQILKTLGVPAEEIKLLTRWNRINLIQRLSTAAAADGSKLGDKYGGFARSHRQSAAESQRIYQRKCQDVFNKMALALSEAVVEEPAAGAGGGSNEDAGDDKRGEEGDDLANELENMLEDEDDEDDGDGDGKGKTEEEMLEEDREEMKRLKEEGLFGERRKKSKDAGKGADAKGKGKAPKKDEAPKRRLRRIFKFLRDDGTIETQEVIITDPHQIETLRLARANYGGVGEGGGVINLTKERKKLQDRHLKLKKRIMKQKKQLLLMKDAGAKGVEIAPAAGAGSSKSAGGTSMVSGTKLRLKAEGTKFKLKVSKKPAKKKRLSPTQRLNRLLKEKIHMPIRRMPISKAFASKVDTAKIKDYEDFVHDQVTLGEISKFLHKNQYSSWMEYQADITKLVENAKAYNDPEAGGMQKNPNLAQQAEFLQILINLRIARYASEIIEAQERCEPLLVALREKYNDELPWVECSKCSKWRMVSFEEHQQLQQQKDGEENPWYCEMSVEREGLACDDEDDEQHFNNLKSKYLL